jgi:hypothetical protein
MGAAAAMLQESSARVEKDVGESSLVPVAMSCEILLQAFMLIDMLYKLDRDDLSKGCLVPHRNGSAHTAYKSCMRQRQSISGQIV